MITDPAGNHAERGISPDTDNMVSLTVEDLTAGYHTYPLTREQMDEDFSKDLILSRAVEMIQGAAP